MFRFKQFTVKQQESAMKVGTDSILLGAWTQFAKDARSILDVGAGTGVLSLMLAQRFPSAFMEAIEVDKDAFDEGRYNFKNSPWSERIHAIHTTFQDFCSGSRVVDRKYDGIISNPPFFTEAIKPQESKRLKARNTSSLSFEELLSGVSKILSKTGSFSNIIPFEQETIFLNLAEQYQLFPSRICRVQGTPNSIIKRSMLDLSFAKKTVDIQNLVVENSRHDYTEEFQNLTKDFYLNF
ncbi:MAG: tRNA (adenine-N(6)-)-methyltransferase [Flavobacteriaceae bacterium]|nr:tRNA (adenine-N(6)-)-methyltransferase [Flavobacteriaceae bacterium]|tara:strand:- start:25770 stop:26483 length:714 start_codon:yes stop_codon:yes gene_type:complete